MSSEIIKISFIIIEYHSVEDVMTCYFSIINQLPVNYDYELIVSSNSIYSIEQQNKLILEDRSLRWVFNKKNGGFAYAMNQGLVLSTGDIVVLINPDVKFKGSIESMVSYLRNDNTIGIIAPQIINSKGEIQDSFRNFITPINFIKRHINRILRRKDFVNITKSPIKVDWVIGAFMMMSREAYNSVKGLDEHYFLYCEDMDLCKRMHLKGYSVIYFPNAKIEYEGTRSARRSSKYAVIFIKSLFRYWEKYGFY